jgi:hypothetical protein
MRRHLKPESHQFFLLLRRVCIPSPSPSLLPLISIQFIRSDNRRRASIRRPPQHHLDAALPEKHPPRPLSRRRLPRRSHSVPPSHPGLFCHWKRILCLQLYLFLFFYMVWQGGREGGGGGREQILCIYFKFKFYFSCRTIDIGSAQCQPQGTPLYMGSHFFNGSTIVFAAIYSSVGHPIQTSVFPSLLSSNFFLF